MPQSGHSYFNYAKIVNLFSKSKPFAIINKILSDDYP